MWGSGSPTDSEMPRQRTQSRLCSEVAPERLPRPVSRILEITIRSEFIKDSQVYTMQSPLHGGCEGHVYPSVLMRVPRRKALGTQGFQQRPMRKGGGHQRGVERASPRAEGHRPFRHCPTPARLRPLQHACRPGKERREKIYNLPNVNPNSLNLL